MQRRYDVQYRTTTYVGESDLPDMPPIASADEFLAWLDELDKGIRESVPVRLARIRSLKVALRKFDRFIWDSPRFEQADSSIRFEVLDRKTGTVIETGRRFL